MERKGRKNLAYAKIKYLTENKTSKGLSVIKSKKKELLSNPTDIKIRWKE